MLFVLIFEIEVLILFYQVWVIVIVIVIVVRQGRETELYLKLKKCLLLNFSENRPNRLEVWKIRVKLRGRIESSDPC